MNIEEIQAKCDALAKAMMSKGLIKPTANCKIENHKNVDVYIKWENPATKGQFMAGTEYKFFSEGTVDEEFSAAFAYVDGLPSADETRMKQFMGALASVIDLGKDNGIDVDFLNPLTATMKRLSSNIIEDKRKDKTA